MTGGRALERDEPLLDTADEDALELGPLEPVHGRQPHTRADLLDGLVHDADGGDAVVVEQGLDAIQLPVGAGGDADIFRTIHSTPGLDRREQGIVLLA